jgi:serine protease
MKLIRTVLFNAVVFVISVLVHGAQSDQEEHDYTGSVLKTLPPDDIVQVMVMHKNEEGRKEAESAASTIVGEIPRFNILVATMSVHNVDGLRNSLNIEGVDLDKGVKVAPRLDEEYEEHSYNVRRASMIQADTTLAGPDAIKICVVDTGYDLGNEYSPKKLLVDGTDNHFYPLDPSLKDHSILGHGTHVAGIIETLTNKNVEVVDNVGKVSPERISLHISRGISHRGSGTMSGVLNAVSNCIDAGAKVVNLSLGHDQGHDRVEARVFNDAFARDGVLMVAAAGNAGTNDYAWPASYPSVMSVGAVDNNGKKAHFSQSNNKVELSAPGINIKSTVPNNGYQSYSGTDVAAPHVTAVAALVWSHSSVCTNAQIRRILLQTAQQFGPEPCNTSVGYGLVQAEDAIILLDSKGCDAGSVDLLSPVGYFEGCSRQSGIREPRIET